MPMKTVCGLDVRRQDERIILQHVLPSADGGQEENKMKIQVAVARKLLTVVWFVLSANCPYKPYDHTAAGDVS